MGTNAKHICNVMIVDDEPDLPERIYREAVNGDQHYDPNPDIVYRPEDVTQERLIRVDIILLDFDFKKRSSHKGDYALKLIEGYKKKNKHINPKIILFSEMENYSDWHKDQKLESLFRIGVVDFAMKYVAEDHPEIFKFQLDKALNLGKQERTINDKEEENQRLGQAISPNLIGNSLGIGRVLKMIQHVAPTNANVLIRGETGTGKELVARLIHAKSPRYHRAFVAQNMGALPDSLVDGELFGWEKGAFTGANFQHQGLFEKAHKGTVFLDEIGDTTGKTQVDLLRVFQEKEVRRLGGNDPIPVDFRLVCATNQNLEKAVKDGQFRQDLFYRLNVVMIDIPPLRKRKDDISLLSEHFLKRYNLEYNKQFTEISPEAISLLVKPDWPGNVRELENTIERSVIMAKGPILMKEDINFGVDDTEQEGLPGSELESGSSDPKPIVKKL